MTEDEIINKITLEELLSRVKKPRWRAALIMYHIGGFTYREVGERLGGVTASRARQMCINAMMHLYWRLPKDLKVEPSWRCSSEKPHR